MTDHLESPLVVVGCERNKGQKRIDAISSLGIDFLRSIKCLI